MKLIVVAMFLSDGSKARLMELNRVSCRVSAYRRERPKRECEVLMKTKILVSTRPFSSAYIFHPPLLQITEHHLRTASMSRNTREMSVSSVEEMKDSMLR